MYASIIGDLVGSPYELVSIKTTDFEFFSEFASFTDDTTMTAAVAEGIIEAGVDAELNEIKECILQSMLKFGNMFPLVGYGERFFEFLNQKNPKPYNSFGNGAAMRVGSIAYFYPDDLERALEVAKVSAEVSHNHPEAIKAAQCVTHVIWMANKHFTKDEIKEVVEEKYYPLPLTCDEIRPDYEFDTSCQKTVPVALQCFFEANSYEEAVRLAVSMGGDSDTIGAIAGSMAGAYYGVPYHLEAKARQFLKEQGGEYIISIIDRFHTVLRSIEDNKPISKKKIREKNFHKMHIQEAEDFEELASKKRDGDLRLYDAKRKNLYPNDYVILICNETGKQCMLRVKELHIYPDCQSVFKTIEDCELYGKCTQYYSVKEQMSPMVLIKYYPI